MPEPIRYHFVMAEEWFYARRGERFGPVRLAKLKALAAEGWLTGADLVWGPGMADWRPAGSVKELFRPSLAESLGTLVDGVIPGIRPGVPPPAGDQPVGSARGDAPAYAPGPIEGLRPRHVVAACGAFVAALGIAFTAIDSSSLALALTLGGLALTVAGMHVEAGRLLSQATANVGHAWRESAERRLEARRLAVEEKRLAVEAARLTAEREAREQQGAAPPAPAAMVERSAPAAGTPAPRIVPADYYSPGEHVTVISHPPVRRWSPAVAAVLSSLVPGLGQLYKGQVLNGLVWFFLVGFGYLALVLPGLVLHFFCIVGAASGNPWTPGRTEVVRLEPAGIARSPRSSTLG